jgi:site-specific recombinase XerD
MAYSYRHTFATRLLMGGMSVEVLANLMGNTSATIHLHYEHLLADTAGLRSQLEGFRKKIEPAPQGAGTMRQG